jgi:1-acyl-sn-glycerol-3-phosphate acyltransferase
MDPFFLALSFKFPVYYFASDDIFNIPVASPIIRYLVAPIPKSKSVADLQSVRDGLQILREGGCVGVFPEGNRTLSGKLWPIEKGIAKFVKLSKVPLILYNIKGGYGSDPRWGTKVRRGKMTGEVVRVVSP